MKKVQKMRYIEFSATLLHLNLWHDYLGIEFSNSLRF